MLTAEQRKVRSRGIGASEIAAILGVPNPGGKTIVDVWARKCRGPKNELPPLVDVDEPEPETCAAFAPYIKGDARTAGSVLEVGIAALYEMMTGLVTSTSGTLSHPKHSWALATPDRWVAHSPTETIDRGLEIKLVGERQARAHWPEDGIAQHVELQCQWCMWVTGLARWDVCALVGGSVPRVVRVERDDALIEDVADVCRSFWFDCVLANEPPPPPTAAAALGLARSVWPNDDGLDVAAPEQAAQYARELLLVARERKALEAREDELKAALATMVGPHARMTAPWGSFSHKTQAGRVSWSAVANELAGGVVPLAVIEKHRGAPTRKAAFYPFKRWATRLLASANAPELPEGHDAQEHEDQ